jgi:site-specific recombinase XerD
MYKLPKIVERFEDYMRYNQNKSEKTIRVYLSDINLFLEYIIKRKNIQIPIDQLEDKFFSHIKENDIYSFLEYCGKTLKNAPSARARNVSSLRTFFKYLKDKKHIIEVNPVADIELPKLGKRLPKYLQLDECKQLLDSIDGEYKIRDICIVTFFLHCGMRLSELVGINIDSIRGDILTVIGKGDKEREIPLDESCVKALNDYLDYRPTMNPKDDKALFISEHGTRISNETIQKTIKKYLKHINRSDLSTHKLRHSAGSLLYISTGDIRAVQEILGHSSISSTQIYTHINAEEKRKTVASNPLNNL